MRLVQPDVVPAQNDVSECREGPPGPLAGLTVVELGRFASAPSCATLLADWGARVIKIERPDSGDFARGYDATMNGLSSQFAWTNRSKESVALDIKTAPGRQALDALLERADVFIQNLAPGAAAKLGLDAQTLVGRQPRLVACDVSGYGADGPYSEKKAYDLLIQVAAGESNPAAIEAAANHL